MKDIKLINKVCVFVGLFILVTLAIICISEPQATDLVSFIPSSILGAALFISGYIGLNIQESNNKE